MVLNIILTKLIIVKLIYLRKLIYFPTLNVVIRCVFKQRYIFYPQVYLDDVLYQL